MIHQLEIVASRELLRNYAGLDALFAIAFDITKDQASAVSVNSCSVVFQFQNEPALRVTQVQVLRDLDRLGFAATEEEHETKQYKITIAHVRLKEKQ